MTLRRDFEDALVNRPTDDKTPVGVGAPATASSNYVLIQVGLFIEMIAAGAKPAAQVGCQRGELEDILRFCREQDIETLVQDVEGDRVSVWMFRGKYLRHVIEEFSRPENSPTIARVWVMGKLFGYSEAEIRKFIDIHFASGVEDAQMSTVAPIPNCPACKGTGKVTCVNCAGMGCVRCDKRGFHYCKCLREDAGRE